MKIYSTTTKINANADTIWAILTDSSAYHDWNKSVEKVEGHIALGEKIKVYAKISPERAFAVKVQEFVPSKRMVWRGGMPLGLFKGVRTFTLTDENNGQVEFRMQEVFSGLMSPLIVRSMPDLTEPFEQFAISLKAEAESIANKPANRTHSS
ncbi:SRPBCC domain-containing protein [Neptunomonas sp.]|uniref:SRPBCC domain-containing protein n=1 Tax=Neptunomonas sp. TaxID=1971898 RepID=UPI0025DC5D40|nr:SRPBCC domain-containing protein [Neptunomonas sp.]